MQPVFMSIHSAGRALRGEVCRAKKTELIVFIYSPRMVGMKLKQKQQSVKAAAAKTFSQ